MPETGGQASDAAPGRPEAAAPAGGSMSRWPTGNITRTWSGWHCCW